MTSKGSDQTAHMRRLIWGFAGHTYNIVGNLVSLIILNTQTFSKIIIMYNLISNIKMPRKKSLLDSYKSASCIILAQYFTGLSAIKSSPGNIISLILVHS